MIITIKKSRLRLSLFECLTFALRSALCFVGLDGCASQPRKNIFLQSPGEILQTVFLLTELDGQTRIVDYERILGGRLILAFNKPTGSYPFQLYKMDGEPDGVRVDLQIDALGVNPSGPKQVAVRLISVDRIQCIPMAKVEEFASTHFKVLGASPFLGYAFTPSQRNNPVVGVTYSQTPTGNCVTALGIFFSRNSNSWEH